MLVMVMTSASPSAEAHLAGVLEESFPSLKTLRLTLREMVSTDALSLLAIHGDREAMRWFGNDPISNVLQAEQMVQTFAGWRRAPATGIRWGIESDKDGRLVGTCGLFRWNRNWKSCVIGYELARDVWGDGLMSEALEKILAWGFVSMGLNRIEAQVHPQNLASLKLLQRLGFVEEGLLRQAGFWHSEHRDLVQLALLRGEFAGAK